MTSKRVVITGVGLVTPVGIGTEEFWAALVAGRSGIAPITSFEASAFRTRIAGEVKGFDFGKFAEGLPLAEPAPGLIRGPIPLHTQYLLAAARLAFQDAGIDWRRQDPAEMGVYVGAEQRSPLVNLSPLGRLYARAAARGKGFDPGIFFSGAEEELRPLALLDAEPNRSYALLASAFHCTGPCLNCHTACAASAQAIGEGLRLIQRGAVSAMLCGGSQALRPLSLIEFGLLKALSTRNYAPQQASRPFDLERDGFVLSEGAGIVLLEELDRATQRGARIYAELIGYGTSCDAYRITDPSPDGEGAARAIKLALQDAGLRPDAVDYINAHGTATLEGDRAETRAIKRIFGPQAYRVPISSTKSMIGHLVLAAGVVELIATVLALRQGILPPTINLDKPDSECDLDYVPHHARKKPVEVALSNSFGFGGQNVVLAVRRWEDSL